MNANKPDTKCPEEKKVEHNQVVEQPSEEVKLPRTMLEYHADLRMKMLERAMSLKEKERLAELEKEYDAHAHEYYDDSSDYDDDKSTYGYSDSDEDDDSTED